MPAPVSFACWPRPGGVADRLTGQVLTQLSRSPPMNNKVRPSFSVPPAIAVSQSTQIKTNAESDKL